jgi:hypothetical protein
VHLTSLLYSLCNSIACCPASPVTFKHLLHVVQPFLLTVLTHPAQCTAACSLCCLIFIMDRNFYAVLTHLLNVQPLAIAVLPYLLYGQALLCCPNSPAQCTAACSLSCLIFFMDRLFYAVLTHLLNVQPLARCPALSSLWTGSSMLSY